MYKIINSFIKIYNKTVIKGLPWNGLINITITIRI